MNLVLHIPLQTTSEQKVRLAALQSAFAEVCNTLAPVVQNTACWNRVALHHLAYRQMRQQFPALGSQMICNAIYSVSRSCRLVYQHPASPFNLQRLAGKPLPLVKFLPQSPVYFDRHTLSLKDGQASMYTLDGRMRFNLPLSPEDEQRFRVNKLREIVLLTMAEGFTLRFTFSEMGPDEEAEQPAQARPDNELPEYLLVLNGDEAAASGLQVPPSQTATQQAPASQLQAVPAGTAGAPIE